jgi:oligopeptide/dipeptide ABC transporter ATP-binding protein
VSEEPAPEPTDEDDEAPPASLLEPVAEEQPFALVPKVKEERPLLLADGISELYPIRRGLFGDVRFVHALEDVSLYLRRGETLGVVGESGSGKSTLGRVLLRLEEPTFGRVTFDGHDVTRLGGKSLQALRRRMQIVFQDPAGSLDPRMTVREIVSEGIEIHDLAAGRPMVDLVAKQLRRVGLDPDVMSRFPHEFSGGERQRVALARALAVRPELVVLDEPTSALDRSVRAHVINLLLRLQQEAKLSYVLISHDLRAIEYAAHRTLVLYLGRVVESGPTFAVVRRSLHPYTRLLIESRPRRGGYTDEQRRRLQVLGEPGSALAPPGGCPFHPRCYKAVPGTCDTEVPKLTELTAGTHHRVACFFPEDPPKRVKKKENEPAV